MSDVTRSAANLESNALARLDPTDPDFAVSFVDQLIALAIRTAASDIHLQPTASGLEVHIRIDGVLHQLGAFPTGASDPVVRLKVLAGLLTYQTATPQEGRLRNDINGCAVRISTFPTIHGERAVVRLQQRGGDLKRLDDLNLSETIRDGLKELVGEQSGAIVVTGPAGSGKTTLLYAFLREVIARNHGQRAILTIEDPVESTIPGTSQSQLDPAAGMNLATALRSMLRQDPEVLLVGELRDPETAEAILQASLTGHLMLTSMHAADIATAVRRMAELNIAPYLIRTGIRAMLSLRLLRRHCLSCDQKGCAECFYSGYRGRVPVAQLLRFDRPTGRRLGEMLQRNADADSIRQLLDEHGCVSMIEECRLLVRAGITDRAEAYRVFGSSFTLDPDMPH